MRRQNRIRRLHAANILVMGSTASAWTLSNFQIITSASVPLGCIAAYNAPIFGCQESDFTGGRTCSASCIRALQMTESLIQSVCDGVSADLSTVLGKALAGTLVNYACGHETTTVTSTRTIGSFSAIPTPYLQTSTRTTESKTKTTETSTSTSTSSDDTETETETSTETPTPTAYPQPTETIGTTSEVDPPPVVTTTVTPVQTTTSAQKTSTPTQQPDLDSGSGGGSPFDAVTVSAASRQMMDRWLEAFLFTNIFLSLLLR